MSRPKAVAAQATWEGGGSAALARGAQGCFCPGAVGGEHRLAAWLRKSKPVLLSLAHRAALRMESRRPARARPWDLPACSLQAEMGPDERGLAVAGWRRRPEEPQTPARSGMNVPRGTSAGIGGWNRCRMLVCFELRRTASDVGDRHARTRSRPEWRDPARRCVGHRGGGAFEPNAVEQPLPEERPLSLYHLPLPPRA